MIITLQIVCIIMCMVCLIGVIGEQDVKQKPMYLTGSVAFIALAVVIQLLFK